jgi:hypothetical protein
MDILISVVDPDPDPLAESGKKFLIRIWAARIRNEFEKNLFNKIYNFSTKCKILKKSFSKQYSKKYSRNFRNKC